MARHNQPGDFTHRDLSVRADHFLLIASFIAGAFGIIFLKLVWQVDWWSPDRSFEMSDASAEKWQAHFPTVTAAAWASVVLISYAVVARALRGREIEPETTGDNCYYLGFLFTLTSLSLTLVQLGLVSESATTDILENIISGFGIALVSTIIGIMLRVYFFQQRADLVARQGEMSFELQKAVRNFRSQLSASSIAMKKFSTESVQLAQERDQKLRDETEAAVKSHLGAVSSLQATADEMNRQQREEIARNAELLADSLENSLKQLVERIPAEVAKAAQQSMSEAFVALDAPVKRLGDSAEALASTLEDSVRQSFERIPGEIAGELRRPVSEIVQELNAPVKRFGSGLNELESKLNDFTESLDSARDELRGGTTGLTRAVSETGIELDKAARQISEAGKTISEQARSAVRATKSVRPSKELASATRNVENAYAGLARVRLLAQSIGEQFRKDARNLRDSTSELSSRFDRLRRIEAGSHDQADMDELQKAADSIAAQLDSISDSMMDLSKFVREETRGSVGLLDRAATMLGFRQEPAKQENQDVRVEIGSRVETARRQSIWRRIFSPRRWFAR